MASWLRNWASLRDSPGSLPIYYKKHKGMAETNKKRGYCKGLEWGESHVSTWGLGPVTRGGAGTVTLFMDAGAWTPQLSIIVSGASGSFEKSQQTYKLCLLCCTRMGALSDL